MNICLKQVTIENWRAITLLSVSESQRTFIESNALCLAESKFVNEWRTLGIYDDEEVVGFAMYGYFDNEDRVWLDRFMIDHTYQGKGYGKVALQLLIKHITSEYQCEKIYLSVFKDNVRAQRLYEKFGFEFNGELDMGGEIVMVHSNNTLKEKLKEIKNNNFKVPEDTNVFDFALNMMEYIGDIDSELRDDLIYETFCEWIEEGVFSAQQLKQLLKVCMDDDHLFYKIGENGTDSVFTRSFSALILALIVYLHRRDDFLEQNDIKSIKEKIIKYMNDEEDVRGYVEGKGWAHSAAHTSDVLDELVQCISIEHGDLLEILQAIKAKVYINNYVYINQEDERMSIPIISIIKRNILNEIEIVNFIRSFENINKIKHYPEDQVVNTKNFLRSIYFRLLNEDNSEAINKEIKETLSKIIGF